MNNSKFDPLIHEPKRLQICAFLEPMKELEFKILRDQLDISESALSKHIKALEEAKYINAEKRVSNGRNRTWISFNKEGRNAFRLHVNALKKIIG